MEGLCSNTPPGEAETGIPNVHRPGKGGLLLPTDAGGNTETLVADVIFSKHPNRTLPALEAFHPYESSTALINFDITSDIVDEVPKKTKGAAKIP